MGLSNFVKANAINTALKKLTDGDTGSTLLGAVAMTLLGMQINFGDLFSNDDNKKAQAIGSICGGIIIGIWAYRTGKKPPPKV